jgi:hypothetical protein
MRVRPPCSKPKSRLLSVTVAKSKCLPFYFKNKDFKLTASNRPSTMMQTSLLEARPASPLELRGFSFYKSECIRSSLRSCRLASQLTIPPQKCKNHGCAITYISEVEGWPCGFYKENPERYRLLGCRLYISLGKQAWARSTDLYGYIFLLLLLLFIQPSLYSYSPRFSTCLFSTECAADAVESIKWIRDCGVRMG